MWFISKKNRGQCQVAKVWLFVHTFCTHFGDEEGSSKSIDICGFPHPSLLSTGKASRHTNQLPNHTSRSDDQTLASWNLHTLQKWWKLDSTPSRYISTVVYTQSTGIQVEYSLMSMHPELSNQAGHVDLQRWWNHLSRLSRCRLVSAMFIIMCPEMVFKHTIERVPHKNDTIYKYIYILHQFLHMFRRYRPHSPTHPTVSNPHSAHLLQFRSSKSASRRVNAKMERCRVRVAH